MRVAISSLSPHTQEWLEEQGPWVVANRDQWIGAALDARRHSVALELFRARVPIISAKDGQGGTLDHVLDQVALGEKEGALEALALGLLEQGERWAPTTSALLKALALGHTPAVVEAIIVAAGPDANLAREVGQFHGLDALAFICAASTEPWDLAMEPAEAMAWALKAGGDINATVRLRLRQTPEDFQTWPWYRAAEVRQGSPLPQEEAYAWSTGVPLLSMALLQTGSSFEFLLAAGADPCRLDDQGMSPLAWALAAPNVGAQRRIPAHLSVPLLLAAGADPKAPNAKGLTPLEQAADALDTPFADVAFRLPVFSTSEQSQALVDLWRAAGYPRVGGLPLDVWVKRCRCFSAGGLDHVLRAHQEWQLEQALPGAQDKARARL